MKILIALLSGTIFGAGLAVAEMTNPAKVQSFLDVAGAWDPSLAFVMGAALLVSTAASALAGRRAESLSGEPFQIPAPAPIDARLLAGAATFGIGWGLAGFCPGPALAALITGAQPVLLFVASMAMGTVGMRLLLATGGSAARRDPART